MARWKPDSRERLAEAALDLYAERGFESTTVAEIAARAGLTERTFFRHFADKREVLFGGSEQLRGLLVAAVANAPAAATPMDAASDALHAFAQVLEPRRQFARQRQAIIAATPELQERELIKMASLASALADALSERGTPEPVARLAAEVAIAVFRLSFERWVSQSSRSPRGLHALVDDALAEFATLRAPGLQAVPAPA